MPTSKCHGFMVRYKTFTKSFVTNKFGGLKRSECKKNKDYAERHYSGLVGVSLAGVCADLEQHSAVVYHHQGMSVRGLFAGL